MANSEYYKQWFITKYNNDPNWRQHRKDNAVKWRTEHRKEFDEYQEKYNERRRVKKKFDPAAPQLAP